MELTSSSGFAEQKLSALNAKADARAMEHANDWDEAIDWGVLDYPCPSEWRVTTAPEFD